MGKLRFLRLLILNLSRPFHAGYGFVIRSQNLTLLYSTRNYLAVNVIKLVTYSMPQLKPKFLAVAILLLAFALRIVAIDHTPPGLSHDEAYNGVAAIQVLEGQRPIFLEINKGIEPLIIYLEALSFYAFGIGPVQMRWVNVISGLLTVALIYPLTKRLFNRRIALLAMGAVACSFWAILVSRLALRAVTLPPLLILTLYFFWRGSMPNRINFGFWILDFGLIDNTLWGTSPKSKIPCTPEGKNPKSIRFGTIIFFCLSGLSAGIAMYTYLSSRFIPFIILIFGFGFLILDCQSIKNRKSQIQNLLLFFLLWAMLFAPLAHYFLTHPDSFSRRANQVLTLPQAMEGNFTPLLKSTARTLGMFTFAGDRTDRYNLDGRPLFDWFNGLLFYFGFGLTLLDFGFWILDFRLIDNRKSKIQNPKSTGRSFYLLTWLFFMLLPGFITGDSPHFLRTIGALPVVYILWAVGLNEMVERVGKWTKVQSLGYFLPLIAYALLFTLTSYDYFYRWANSNGTREIYGADIAEIAHYIHHNGTKDLTIISASYYRDLDPFRYALHWQGHPPYAIWFDGQQSIAFPPAQSNLNPRYLFAASAPPANMWLKFLQPYPLESGQAYTLYRLPKEFSFAQVELATTLNININNEVKLVGYQTWGLPLPSRGRVGVGEIIKKGKVQILLAWQALRTLPPGTDYTFLVRLRDQERILAETDGLGCSPADWQPGVQGLQLLTLRLPSDLPARPYHLTIEMVNRQTGQALPTTTGETVIQLNSNIVGKSVGKLLVK